MAQKKWTQQETNHVLDTIVAQYRFKDFNSILDTIADEVNSTRGCIKMGLKNCVFILTNGQEGLSGFNSKQTIAINYVLEKYNITRNKLLMILD